MAQFTVRIAETVISVTALFDSTETFCRDYICSATPDISVAVLCEDIEREREYSERENKINNEPIVNYSDAYLETLALYRKICEELIDRDILLFHGAGISVNGSGILFTAPSGTGKTTHIKLWHKLCKRENRSFAVINGDKPLIKITEDGVKMFGTPWQGKEGYGCNSSAPLNAIVVLARGESNRMDEVKVSSVLDVLIQQSYRPRNSMKLIKTLSMLDKLSRNVKTYKLFCNMDISAAEVAYNAVF